MMRRLAVYLWAICALLFAAAAFLMANPAHGGNVSRHCVRVAPVVAKSVVPYYAPVYYRVGQQLQQQAVDTHGFRNSPEWQEYRDLKAFKEGVLTVQAMLQQQAAAPGGAERHPAAPAPPAEELPPTPPQSTPAGPVPPDNAVPPAAPQSRWDAFKARFPVIAANCSSCHGRNAPDDPDGGLYLNGDMDLEGPDAGPRRLAILEQAYRGHMPPNKPLDDVTFSALLAEVLAE